MIAVAKGHRGRARAIVIALWNRPGRTVDDLARAFRTTPERMRWALDRLRRADAVRRERARWFVVTP